MRRKREFFSLVVVGLLLIGAGLVFAGIDFSNESSRTPTAREVRIALYNEFGIASVPGFAGTNHIDSEEEVVIVYVETEEDKAKIPDSYMGYPIQKEVGCGAEEAKQALYKEFGDVPGVEGASVTDSDGTITVLVKTEEDKAKIPDSYMGYPIRKEVGEVHVLRTDNTMTGSKYYWSDNPIRPSWQLMKPGMVRDGFTLGSSGTLMNVGGPDRDDYKAVPNLQTIEMNLKIGEFSMPGTLTIEGGNYTMSLPDLQSIGINSKIAEFSMPGTFTMPSIPTIQPGSSNTGMLSNDGWLLGTISKPSLPQPFAAPIIILPESRKD